MSPLIKHRRYGLSILGKERVSVSLEETIKHPTDETLGKIVAALREFRKREIGILPREWSEAITAGIYDELSKVFPGQIVGEGAPKPTEISFEEAIEKVQAERPDIKKENLAMANFDKFASNDLKQNGELTAEFLGVILGKINTAWEENN